MKKNFKFQNDNKSITHIYLTDNFIEIFGNTYSCGLIMNKIIKWQGNKNPNEVDLKYCNKILNNKVFL